MRAWAAVTAISLLVGLESPTLEPLGKVDFLSRLIPIGYLNHKSASVPPYLMSLVNKPGEMQLSVAEWKLIHSGPDNDWHAEYLGTFELRLILPILSRWPIDSEWCGSIRKYCGSNTPNKRSFCVFRTKLDDLLNSAISVDGVLHLPDDAHVQCWASANVRTHKYEIEIHTVNIVLEPTGTNRNVDGYPWSVSGVIVFARQSIAFLRSNSGSSGSFSVFKGGLCRQSSISQAIKHDPPLSIEHPQLGGTHEQNEEGHLDHPPVWSFVVALILGLAGCALIGNGRGGWGATLIIAAGAVWLVSW